MSYEGPSIDTTEPVYTGPLVPSYPFASDGDLTHVVASQEYIVRAESYVAPALNTTITFGAATLYLVGDYEHSVIESGCIQFTRRWASIPSARTRPSGSYAFTFPGMPLSVIGPEQTITAFTFGASTSVATVTGHGYLAGQNLLISITLNYGSFRLFQYFLTYAISVTTNTITFPISNLGGTFVSGTVRAIVPARNPRTEKPTAYLRSEYALPGVTSGITTATDFRAMREFRVSSKDSAIDPENVLSTGTIPTLAEYNAMIANSEFIVVESNVNVYMGDILQRQTLLVLAQ